MCFVRALTQKRKDSLVGGLEDPVRNGRAEKAMATKAFKIRGLRGV